MREERPCARSTRRWCRRRTRRGRRRPRGARVRGPGPRAPHGARSPPGVATGEAPIASALKRDGTTTRSAASRHWTQWSGMRSVSHAVCPTRRASGRRRRTSGKYSATRWATTTWSSVMRPGAGRRQEGAGSRGPTPRPGRRASSPPRSPTPRAPPGSGRRPRRSRSSRRATGTASGSSSGRIGWRRRCCVAPAAAWAGGRAGPGRRRWSGPAGRRWACTTPRGRG